MAEVRNTDFASFIDTLLEDYVNSRTALRKRMFTDKNEAQTLTSTSANYIINRLSDKVDKLQTTLNSVNPFDKTVTLANGTTIAIAKANKCNVAWKETLDQIAQYTSFIAYLGQALEEKKAITGFCNDATLDKILTELSSYNVLSSIPTQDILAFKLYLDTYSSRIKTLELTERYQTMQRNAINNTTSLADIVKPIIANAKASVYGKILARDKSSIPGKIPALDAELKNYSLKGGISAMGNGGDMMVTTYTLSPDFDLNKFNDDKEFLHQYWRELEADVNHYKGIENETLENARKEAENIFLMHKQECDKLYLLFNTAKQNLATKINGLRIVIPNAFLDLYNTVKGDKVE